MGRFFTLVSLFTHQINSRVSHAFCTQKLFSLEISESFNSVKRNLVWQSVTMCFGRRNGGLTPTKESNLWVKVQGFHAQSIWICTSAEEDVDSNSTISKLLLLLCLPSTIYTRSYFELRVVSSLTWLVAPRNPTITDICLYLLSLILFLGFVVAMGCVFGGGGVDRCV